MSPFGDTPEFFSASLASLHQNAAFSAIGLTRMIASLRLFASAGF
ncbi:MAG: hypothetical protein ACLUNV_06585 [Sutterella wadsworthensis]